MNKKHKCLNKIFLKETCIENYYTVPIKKVQKIKTTNSPTQPAAKETQDWVTILQARSQEARKGQGQEAEMDEKIQMTKKFSGNKVGFAKIHLSKKHKRK